MDEEVKPYSPQDALERKRSLIPKEVITVINRLLAEKYEDGRDVTIYQSEIVAEIIKAFKQMSDIVITEDDILKNKLLNFESLYANHGWVVNYDAPSYDETYAARFIFKPKRGFV